MYKPYHELVLAYFNHFLHMSRSNFSRVARDYRLLTPARKEAFDAIMALAED